MFEYELLIPIVSVIATAVVLCVWLVLRYRHRVELQRTVRGALEKGQALTPELIESLGHPRHTRESDLRKALIWLALGIACGAFGLLVGEPDAVRPFLAIGAFPFLIGIAYLVIWRFGETPAST
jgi:hypothetical protein